MSKGKASDLVRRLQLLASFADRHQVLVGVPAGAGVHEGGMNNAALGYLFEVGDPATSMPPRPWLLPGVKVARGAIQKELVAGYQRAVRVILKGGSMPEARAELTKSQHKVGLLAQNAIRGRIQAGIAPPLSPRTVYARMHRKKNRRSGGSMTPLYDTGQFIRSITYVITWKEYVMPNENVWEQFVVALGFKTDEPGAKKMQAQAVAIAGNLTNIVTLAVAAGAAVTAAVAKIAGSFNTLYYESGRVNSSVQNLKALQFAFAQTGGTAQQATTAIENYARAIRTNPGNAKFVKDLGVDMKTDSWDQVLAIVDKLNAKHPYYVGQQYAEMLGIDEGTYKLMTSQLANLKAYRAEYEKTTKRFGFNSKEASEASNRLMSALGSLSMTGEVLVQKLMLSLAPAIERTTQGFLRWLDSHPKLIEKVMRGIGMAVDFCRAYFQTYLAVITTVFDFMSERAAAMNKDGGFLRLWEKIAAIFERVVSGIKSVLTWLNQLDRATDMSGGLRTLGRFLGFIEGKTASFAQSGAQAARYIDGATETGVGVSGDGEKPGIVRRGINALKRAIGLGDGTTASLPSLGNGKNPILDLITKAEGTKRGYDDSFAHQIKGTLTDKTLDEIDQIQRGMRGSSAIGKYQFMRKTLGGLRRELGLSGSERFDADLQDKLALRLYDRRLAQARKAGGGRDATLLALAQEWASFPTSSGSGYYPGQRASVTPDQVMAAVTAQSAARANPRPASSPAFVPPKGFNPGSFDVSRLGGQPMGASSTSNDNSRSVSMNNPVTINMNSSGDPATTASFVERSMNRVNESAMRNAQRAVR